MALNRETVIDEGLRLLNDVGLDSLSTRKLAERLGVQVGALYWHVASKQDLLAGVTDRIAARALSGAPPDGPWDDQVAELARRLRAAILAHRDGARLMAAGPTAPTPNVLRLADRMLGVLCEAGLPMEDAASGSDTILSYVTGFTSQEQAERARGGADAEQETDTYDTDRLPYLAEWLPRQPPGRDVAFEAGLKLIITGLRAEVAKL